MTFRIAKRVPKGRVFAVDIQPEMLGIMRKRVQERSIENVTLIRGTVEDPKLPADSIDAALMVDAYHEFSHPREMMTGLVEALPIRVKGPSVFSRKSGTVLYVSRNGLHEPLPGSVLPGGRVYLVEYRKEDPNIPIKPLHKMSEAQARKEMAAVGLEWVDTKEMLPRQHFMVFRKPTPVSSTK